MANRKISDLTALTTPATGDLLPIVDISEAAAADKNKKITYGNLFTRIPAGIGFPATQVASADPNTLDDYEEGTWTPTLSDTLGNSAVMTSGLSGFYTKVGNTVVATFNQMSWSSKGTLASNLTLSGLPFTSRNGNRSIALIGVGSGGAFSSVNKFVGILEANGTVVTFYNPASDNGLTVYSVASTGTSGTLYGFQLTYFV